MNLSIYVFKRYRASVGNKVLSFPTELNAYLKEAVDAIVIPYKQQIKLIVLRQGNLVHYLYVVNIDADLVGFAFTMNGAYLADVGTLCRMCSDIIAAISSQGLVITWSGRNGLVFTTKNVAAYREEAEKVMPRLVELRDNSAFSNAIPLPPLDYSDAKQSKRLDWSAKTEVDTIPEEYRHIDILEIKLPIVDYSVAKVLESANKEADNWKKHYSDLAKRYHSIKRQKKRMKWVVILALCLIAGGIILFGVKKDLKFTQSNLSDANNRIDSLYVDIDSLNSLNTTYLNDISSLKTFYLKAVDKISSYESIMPITINNILVCYMHDNNWYDGVPSSNYTSLIRLKVNYTVNKYKVANIDSIPHQPACSDMNNGNEVAVEIEKPMVVDKTKIELRIRLRCYYRKNTSDNFTYKDMGGTNPFTINISSSGSFITPDFNMGFSKMPAGEYRIEVWNDTQATCLSFRYFTIY